MSWQLTNRNKYTAEMCENEHCSD